jgi:glycosyltransferase involved in cell wall biosynthesis
LEPLSSASLRRELNWLLLDFQSKQCERFRDQAALAPAIGRLAFGQRTASLNVLGSLAMSWVSVVIPVFNNAATISRAITSVLAQRFHENGDGDTHTGAVVEVIVVNDGSTDASAEVLRSFGDRIRVIEQPNRGAAAARNAGVAAAHGEYLAFLDADDAWLPRKLAATIPLLDRNPGVVLVFSDAIPVDAAGAPVGESYVTGDSAHAPTIAEMLERWWPIIPSTAVMRIATFNACGGFVEEFRAAAYEDPLLFLIAREHGEFAYVPERLVYYHYESPGARMKKYEPYRELFMRRVRERYGGAAHGLIRSTQRAYAGALGYEGLLAMRSGDMSAARHYFARAWCEQPLDLKTALRFVRTFLPLTLARRLSGRTRR